MNILATHAAGEARLKGMVADVVPAVLGTNNALGVNFLETFLVHHLVDNPQVQPILVPVNLGERHWIGLHLTFEHGAVKVWYFDSIQPNHVNGDVAIAVTAALGLAGYKVEFLVEFQAPVQTDGVNCGPWVIEWMRWRLGLADWRSALPLMPSARAQHLRVTGVQDALSRDEEGKQWGLETDWQAESTKTLQRFLALDISRRFVLPHGNLSGPMLGFAQLLIRSRKLPLGLLYRRFLEDEDAKRLAEGLFAVRIRQIDRRYRETKQLLLSIYGIESQAVKTARPWQKKVEGLGKSSVRPYAKLQLGAKGTFLSMGSVSLEDLTDGVAVVDLSASDQVDWLSLSLILTVIRKRFSARWQQKPGNHRHVTVVVLPGKETTQPCFWALNTKDENGNGTTRILLPLCAEPSTNKKTARIRLLDLTYEQVKELTVEGTTDRDEVAYSLGALVSGLAGKDPTALGRTLLELMSPSSEVQARCRGALAGSNVFLDRMHCLLFFGATLQQLQCSSGASYCVPVLDEGWGIGHPPKTAPGAKILNMNVSALQLAYYFLGILVAETRHARGVYVSTIDLLELVQLGLVSPSDMFSSLDGHIEHGWLLPGANFLGGTMTPALKRLAMPMVGAVARAVTPVEPVPDPRRARLGEILERRWDNETTIEDPSHPVYQVLMKCLFITLLRFLARCSSDAGPDVSVLRSFEDKSHAWPVGYEPTDVFFWKALRSGHPTVSDLLTLLFDDKKPEHLLVSDLEHAEALLERAARIFSGSDLERFCWLFRVTVRCWSREDSGWGFRQMRPASLDKTTSKIGGRVLATIEYVAASSGGIHGWRIIVPPQRTAKEYLASVRHLFSKEVTTSDFEELLDKLDPSKEQSTTRKKRKKKDDEEYHPSESDKEDY